MKKGIHADCAVSKAREMLRQRFEAQTDVEIDPQPCVWEKYAKWLENASIKALNAELGWENEMLRTKMRKAIDALEQGISGAKKPKPGIGAGIRKKGAV